MRINHNIAALNTPKEKMTMSEKKKNEIEENELEQKDLDQVSGGTSEWDSTLSLADFEFNDIVVDY